MGRQGEYSSDREDGFLDIIKQAALNPNVDADKLKHLLNEQERLSACSSRLAFDAAFLTMFAELPTITENGTIQDRHGRPVGTYAKWADMHEIIRPILSRHGFSLRFRLGHAGDKISVTGILSHRRGHSEETTVLLPSDASGSKNSVQAVGSSASYGQRYTAKALMNLVSRAPQDADDDAAATGVQALISSGQVAELEARILTTGANKARFLDWLGVESLECLPASRLDAALLGLRHRLPDRRR